MPPASSSRKQINKTYYQRNKQKIKEKQKQRYHSYKKQDTIKDKLIDYCEENQIKYDDILFYEFIECKECNMCNVKFKSHTSKRIFNTFIMCRKCYLIENS